jgi:maltose O-acetyltransferase
MWRIALVKMIPGRMGCVMRNWLLPYRQGRNCTVWDHVHLEEAKYITLGDNVSVNRYSLLHGGGGITIGSNVLIGPGVTIYSQNHGFGKRGQLIESEGYIRKPVVIGNDVWLAANVIVLPGVTIGDHVVVAAGSVVTRDIPTEMVAAGNPARPIRRLYDSE